jgi:hypothetical protein
MIFAIDPGPITSGIVWWDGQTVAVRGIFPNEGILDLLHRFKHPVALEMIASYGMPVGKETFETVLWIGRFIEAATCSGSQVRTVYRKDIKMHLCHSMRAKDGNVRQALIDRLGPPGTKKKPGVAYGITSHLWSALAVAVYVHDCPDAGELRK